MACRVRFFFFFFFFFFGPHLGRVMVSIICGAATGRRSLFGAKRTFWDFAKDGVDDDDPASAALVAKVELLASAGGIKSSIGRARLWVRAGLAGSMLGPAVAHLGESCSILFCFYFIYLLFIVCFAKSVRATNCGKCGQKGFVFRVVVR